MRHPTAALRLSPRFRPVRNPDRWYQSLPLSELLLGAALGVVLVLS